MMCNLRYLLITAVLLFGACRITFAASTYPFAVTVEKESAGHRIVARNDGPAPVSVMVSFPMVVNARADRATPIYAVVPPNGGVLHLAHVTPVLQGASSTFKTQSTWAIGDFNGRQDGTPYRLPYPDGYTFRIGQAPGGPITTHTAPDARFAVDIPMPEGTPIVAAREGLVVKTQADQLRGGIDPALKAAANSVEILHADGTIALYAHLAPGGVRVYPGQRVTAGVVIGLSGSTGYSSGPHLHFAVSRLVRTNEGFRSESVPFDFYVGAPASVFSPAYGQRVEADYTGAGNPPIAPSARMSTMAGTRISAQAPDATTGPRRGPLAFSVEISDSLLMELSRITYWQWLVAISVVVVTAMVVSNVRYARGRRAMDRLGKSEPHIRE